MQIENEFLMSIEIFSAFIMGRIILSGTPGPGVLTSVTEAVSNGFKTSLFFLSGIVLCNVIFLLLAIFGLSVISRVMGEMFFIIKIASGIYLIILGIRLYIRNFQLDEKIKSKKENSLNTFLSGFLLTLGNPEPILFYASFVTTILNGKVVSMIDITAMIFIIITIAYLVTGSYCYIASLSRSFLLKNNIFGPINRIAGVVMCLIGSYMIFK